MIIEKIFECESRVPGLLFIRNFPETGYFHDKTKTFKENLQVNYLMLKMLQKAMYLASSNLSHVTKFNSKMQDFKRVLNLTWSKGKDFFQLTFMSQKCISFKWL